MQLDMCPFRAKEDSKPKLSLGIKVSAKSLNVNINSFYVSCLRLTVMLLVCLM